MGTCDDPAIVKLVAEFTMLGDTYGNIEGIFEPKVVNDLLLEMDIQTYRKLCCDVMTKVAQGLALNPMEALLADEKRRKVLEKLREVTESKQKAIDKALANPKLRAMMRFLPGKAPKGRRGVIQAPPTTSFTELRERPGEAAELRPS